MLPRRRKLSHSSFPSYKEPRRQWSGAVLRINWYTQKNKTQTKALFAVIVSKKAAKKAVTRNRLKREIFSAMESRLPEYPSGRYVFSVKQAALLPTRAEITADVENFLKQLSTQANGRNT